MFSVIKTFISLLVVFALVAGCERGAFRGIWRESSHIVNPALETQIALLDGNWEQVITYGNRWSETEKDNVIPHLLVGFAYCMKGEYEHQKEEFSLAFKDDIINKVIISWCNALVEKEPFNHHAYGLLAAVYTYKELIDEAIRNYKKAIEVNPEYAEGYSNVGAAFLSKGNIDAAIENCKKAIQINSKYSVAYYNLGLAYHSKGEIEQAIENYKKAIEINPGYAKAYRNLGLTYRSKGRIVEEIESYKKAIKIDPEYVDAYNELGYAYYRKGEIHKTIKYCKKALKINPDCAAAYNNLGVVCRDKGEIDDSIDNCKKAIEINPRYVGAYYNLGLAFYTKGAMGEAIDNFKKAIEIDPGCAGAYITLGTAYADEGQIHEALKCYKKAIEINPNYANTYIGELIKGPEVTGSGSPKVQERKAVAKAKVKPETSPAPGVQKVAANGLVKEKTGSALVVSSNSLKVKKKKKKKIVYSVQVGSFLSAGNAREFAVRLLKKGYKLCFIKLIDKKGRLWYIIQIGDFEIREEAVAAGVDFKKQEKMSYHIKAIDSGLLAERLLPIKP